MLQESFVVLGLELLALKKITVGRKGFQLGTEGFNNNEQAIQ